MIGTTAHNMVQKTDVKTLRASFAPRTLYEIMGETKMALGKNITKSER